MWTIDTRWFDVAIVLGIFAFGSVLFGRFEEHKPRGRRIAKVVLVLAITVLLAEFFGRAVAYAVLAVPLLGAAYVHIWWLPRHGVSGWTAEPRDRYYALLAERGRL